MHQDMRSNSVPPAPRGPVVGPPGGVERRQRGARGMFTRDAFGAAMTALDLTGDELRGELAKGMSLADVAKAKGVTVPSLTASILAVVTADLDRLVERGAIPVSVGDDVRGELPLLVKHMVRRHSFGPVAAHGKVLTHA